MNVDLQFHNTTLSCTMNFEQRTSHEVNNVLGNSFTLHRVRRYDLRRLRPC